MTHSYNAAAYEMALRGFRVFEIPAGCKFPASKGWQAAATDDVIDACELPPGNVGVVTDGWLVVDADAGKGGLESAERMKAAGLLLPTLTVRSARGGLHFYYRAADGEKFQSRAYAKFKDGKETFAVPGFPGVDIRAEGGLVVAPGSTFDGKPYVIECDMPPAERAAPLAALCSAAREKSADRAKVAGTLDDPAAVADAITYLVSAPPAVEGCGGDPHTITVANRVMDCGIAPDTAAALMLEFWNDGCSPPWDDDDLACKVLSAANSRQDPIGRDNPSNAFDVFEMAPAEPAPPANELLEGVGDISLQALLAAQANDLVRGLIGCSGVGVLYGDPGAGKTFIAMQMGWAIACGAERWHDRKIKRAPVLYVGLEGAEGVRKRMIALQKDTAPAASDSSGGFFRRLKFPVSLTRGDAGAEGAKWIVAAATAQGDACGRPVRLIIIDTLSRAMAGDNENAAEDMMHFIGQRVGFIEQKTGAVVLNVHHKSKAGDMRGSGALRGAADFVLRCDHDTETGRRSLHAEKVKDGEEGPLFEYRLEKVELGTDPDGCPVTSCVVRTGQSEPRQRERAGVLLQIVGDAIAAGENISPNPKAPHNYVAQIATERQKGTNFTKADFRAEFEDLRAIHFVTETYDSNGKTVERLKLRAPDTSPTVRDPDSSDTSSTLPPATIGGP